MSEFGVVPPPEILSETQIEQERHHWQLRPDNRDRARFADVLRVFALCDSHEALRARVEAAEADLAEVKAQRPAVVDAMVWHKRRADVAEARVEALTAALAEMLDAFDGAVGRGDMLPAMEAAERVLADGGTTDAP